LLLCLVVQSSRRWRSSPTIARWLEIQFWPLYPLETLTFHLLLIVWVRGGLLCFVDTSQAQNVLEIVVVSPVHCQVNCNGTNAKWAATHSHKPIECVICWVCWANCCFNPFAVNNDPSWTWTLILSSLIGRCYLSQPQPFDCYVSSLMWDNGGGECAPSLMIKGHRQHVSTHPTS
jgi:hypothetical protein